MIEYLKSTRLSGKGDMARNDGPDLKVQTLKTSFARKIAGILKQYNQAALSFEKMDEPIAGFTTLYR